MRILFVEDNESTAKAMKVMLELKGYTVELAATVADALVKLGSLEFDVLISDLTLPDGTGHEILERSHSNIPAIALSGHVDEDTREDALRRGFRQYVTKPFRTPDLIAAIEVAVR